MIKDQLILRIIDTLKTYPEILYKINEGKILIIDKKENDGFDIRLEDGHKEYTLYLGHSFHWHYDKEEYGKDELYRDFFYCLTGVIRIKNYLKNGEIFKSKMEVQDREGNWFGNGTIGFISLKFWYKTEIEYQQNIFIEKQLFYNK